MKLFLLSGFLGSGKTTAIQQACSHLITSRIRVGVIANDQGSQLVDSVFMRSFQIPGREVVNGCFCCNYTQLVEGIQSLKKESNPGIIFAESVGSCTDIVATVVKPLRKFYPELEIVLSVFADADILLKILEGGSFCFDEDVNYIYEKQLEEADVLVINKVDLLDEKQLYVLKKESAKKFIHKKILFQNSLKKEDVLEWLNSLKDFNSSIYRRSLEINYSKYGSGEAKLAWLDEEIEIISERGNALEMGTKFINRIYEKICRAKYPLGHIKFMMQSGEWQRKISFTTLSEPLLKQTHSPARFERIILLINARVLTTPDEMRRILSEAKKELSGDGIIVSKGLSVFKPGYPKPEYRIE